MRRVVTGHSGEGKAIVALDSDAPRVTLLPNYPGYAMHEMWSTGNDTHLPFPGVDPTLEMDHFIPAVGETRFSIMEIPTLGELQRLAESGTINIPKAYAEFAEAMPNMGRATQQTP
jgi:hypothetical protein